MNFKSVNYEESGCSYKSILTNNDMILTGILADNQGNMPIDSCP